MALKLDQEMIMFKFFDKLAANSFKKLVRIYLNELTTDWNRIERCFPASTLDTAYEQAWQQFGKNSITRHPDDYKAEAQAAAVFVMEYLTVWDELRPSRLLNV